MLPTRTVSKAQATEDLRKLRSIGLSHGYWSDSLVSYIEEAEMVWKIIEGIRVAFGMLLFIVAAIVLGFLADGCSFDTAPIPYDVGDSFTPVSMDASVLDAALKHAPDAAVAVELEIDSSVPSLDDAGEAPIVETCTPCQRNSNSCGADFVCGLDVQQYFCFHRPSPDCQAGYKLQSFQEPYCAPFRFGEIRHCY